MDNNTLSIYVHELRNQANFVEASFSLFNQALQGNNGIAVLYSAQNIMASSSQIAGLLWPSRARNRSRGESLRKVLDLPEKHPLNDRRLTEMHEAPDQKLEDWIGRTRGQKIVFDFIGPVSRIPAEEGLTEANFFRAYDPETKVFYYRGVAYNLESVAKAIGAVGSRVIQLHRQMFPEQAEAERKAAQEAQAAQQAASAPAEPEAEKPAPKKKAPAKKAAPKKAAAKKAAPKKAPAKKKPASKKD